MSSKKSNAVETTKQDLTQNTDPKEVKRKIHNRILDARNHLKDKSNADLARELEVSDNLLSTWLNPDRCTISYQLLQLLHNKYGADLNYIICGDSGITEESAMQELTNVYKQLEEFLSKEK